MHPVTINQPPVLTLIRHAPVISDGCLYGRRDLPADCSDTTVFSNLRAKHPRPERLIVSPATRCRQTAQAIWPDCPMHEDAQLWEQDFGTWEGITYADLPDLGPLPSQDLARHRPPKGESFEDVCARVATTLRQIAKAGSATCVVHAGTIRAALAMHVGAPAALAFSVENLSETQITLLPGAVAINYVNRIV